MVDALKNLVIEAIDPTYIAELKVKYTGFMGVTTRDLIYHLMDSYAKIITADLRENEIRMKEPIDTGLPIEKYFERVDCCVQFADNGKAPYTTDQIKQTEEHTILTTGTYLDE